LNCRFEIYLLHSSITTFDQQAAFKIPPPGVRKIILSTNIAETSVTIPDVVYVIDSARVKEMTYDPNKRTKSLDLCWISKANSKQRKGRAGRVRSGFYFSLISQDHYDSFLEYQVFFFFLKINYNEH